MQTTKLPDKPQAKFWEKFWQKLWRLAQIHE